MDNPVDQPVNRCQDRVMFQSQDLTRKQIVVPARSPIPGSDCRRLSWIAAILLSFTAHYFQKTFMLCTRSFNDSVW